MSVDTKKCLKTPVYLLPPPEVGRDDPSGEPQTTRDGGLSHL